MRITEYQNSFAYDPPGMTCDAPISKHIKEPLPNTAAFVVFCGIPGSGKSSLAISLLTHPEGYHKCFHHIFVVMPKTSRASIAGDPFEKHPEDKLFEELDASVLEKVESYCKVACEETQHSLLFLDDCAASLKDPKIQKLLKSLVYNRRHLKLTIWMLVQSYITIPLSLRKTISHLVMFKPRNRKETQTLFEELVFLPKEDQEALLLHVFDQPHNFLLLDTARGRFHKNFNQLELAD